MNSKNAWLANHMRSSMETSKQQTLGELLVLAVICHSQYLDLESVVCNTHAHHNSHSVFSWTKSKFIVCIDLRIHKIPCHHVPMSTLRPQKHHMQSQCECMRTNTKPIPATPICLRLQHQEKASRLFLLLLGRTLDLRRTSESLLSVLALLALLSAGLLDL